MGDVAAAIAAFIRDERDELRLSRPDISAAVKSREWFLGRIASEISKRDGEPTLYSPQPFVYFGSYFKQTKVATVDEFDVLVVIDSNTGIFSRGGVRFGVGLGSAYPNHKYDARFFKSDGSGVSPSKTLNWLKGVVENVVEGFRGESPERKGQAVKALIKSLDLKIDLVPAGVFIRDSDGLVFYNIPAGDAGNNWILTSPRQDIELLAAVAKGKDGFRDVVRLCKHIRTSYNFLVSSFAIESCIVQYGSMANPWYGNCWLDLTGALNYLAAAVRSGYVADPYDPTNNLIDGIQSLEWYAERVAQIASRLDLLSIEPDQWKVKEQTRRILMNQV